MSASNVYKALKEAIKEFKDNPKPTRLTEEN